MAEASCSGSTPFKRLVDHQSTGLGQQDRLVDRTGASGSNSFRSSPAPTASPNGFDAFVGANSVLPAFHHDPATRLAAHASNLQPVQPEFSRHSPAPDLSSWAADFSRFSAAQQRPARPINQANMGYGSVFGLSNGASFMAPTMAHQQQQQQQQPTGQSEFDEEMVRWMSLHGGGNMQDVDAMMDRMARELEQNEAALAAFEVEDGEEQQQQQQQQQDETAGASLQTKESPLLVEREEHEEKEADGDVPSKSAVAEAAEKLLDCVKHEGGDKWQNSVFLSLMRDFRDGKKDIVGDEIRMARGEPQQT